MSMINQVITTAALSLGFARVFFLKPMRLEHWRAHANALDYLADMPFDIQMAFPKAKAVALLVWAYKPYRDGEPISPYYIESNKAYFAAKALEKELARLGINFSRGELPLRALALANGIGTPCKNGLISIEPYGTRTVLEALLIEDEIELSPPAAAERGEQAAFHRHCCGESCTLCINACPMGAIDQSGLYVLRCMRYVMGKGYTREVRLKQTTFLGCEVCQQVCPENARLEKTRPDAAALAAFDLGELIRGNTAAARRAVGRNITSKGRLTAEAIMFAAKQGLFEKEIRACLASPFEQVKNAAELAVKTFFTK